MYVEIPTYKCQFPINLYEYLQMSAFAVSQKKKYGNKKQTKQNKTNKQNNIFKKKHTNETKKRDFDKCNELMKIMADSWLDINAIPARCDHSEVLRDMDEETKVQLSQFCTHTKKHFFFHKKTTLFIILL